MSLRELIVKIRTRETPFFDRLYLIAKAIRGVEVPVIRPFHRFLYAERAFRLTTWRELVRTFYHEPLFKSQCAAVGRSFRLYDGIPQIMGNLQVKVGDNVVLHGSATLIGAKVFDRPTLTVGDNTHLGSSLGIIVGEDVTIGSNVLIANGVNIMSYDGHPANPAERHLPAPPESSRPVVIEDNVWIGAKSVILKGVTVGRNSVVVSGSVVTQKVPADSLVIGNPARVFPLMV